VMLGGDMGGGSADPSLITTVFAAGGMTTATNPAAFDPGIDHMLSMAGMIEGYHSQSNSEFYTTGGGTERIPEPSAIVLLLAGMAGLGTSRRSRRG
jgi:hypothetical protein